MLADLRDAGYSNIWSCFSYWACTTGALPSAMSGGLRWCRQLLGWVSDFT